MFSVCCFLRLATKKFCLFMLWMMDNNTNKHKDKKQKTNSIETSHVLTNHTTISTCTSLTSPIGTRGGAVSLIWPFMTLSLLLEYIKACYYFCALTIPWTKNPATWEFWNINIEAGSTYVGEPTNPHPVAGWHLKKKRCLGVNLGTNKFLFSKIKTRKTCKTC